jgi:lactate dehydrogenase-like 2-hydroxyacid dehydrogenase
MAGNYSLGPLVGMELRGKHVAVIGTGAIGIEAIRLFKVRCRCCRFCSSRT